MANECNHQYVLLCIIELRPTLLLSLSTYLLWVHSLYLFICPAFLLFLSVLCPLEHCSSMMVVGFLLLGFTSKMVCICCSCIQIQYIFLKKSATEICLFSIQYNHIFDSLNGSSTC